jgi:pimeloyl-ACP methyl ester carboxylesterase
MPANDHAEAPEALLMATPAPADDGNFLVPYQGARPPAPAWFESALQCEPQRTFFLSDGANIELLSWGREDAPALLFLHGNGAHAEWWSHIAPLFAARWRCVALSYSGMGRSDWRAEGYTVDTFAQEVLDAVTAAGLDQGPTRPILVAHSFGGAVGIAAASRADCFGGLVMIDTPVNMDREVLREIKARAPKARTEHPGYASLVEGLARFRLSPPQPCPNDFIGDHIARCALVERDGKWHWRFDPRRVNVNPEREDDSIDAVRCPLAYFYGEHSALITPGVLASSLPLFPAGTPVVEIPDAAHHIMIDQPLALVASLRTLLGCWPARGNTSAL